MLFGDYVSALCGIYDQEGGELVVNPPTSHDLLQQLQGLVDAWSFSDGAYTPFFARPG